MKILVVYYSRSGRTEKVAQQIARLLGGELEKINDNRNRLGFLGYLGAGRDALFRKITDIRAVRYDPTLYDLVIIGSPVWVMTVSTPIRTYLIQFQDRLKRTAFFCTYGGMGSGSALKAMADLCQKEPVATLTVQQALVDKGGYLEKVKGFAQKVQPL
ncbi:MAG TPA: hypothetical protein EYP58_05870 [bacterium (Candidatus Stahlbacteria)]|nr:hypothetical protein [Candidatus Stahlbacteria bacterium]